MLVSLELILPGNEGLWVTGKKSILSASAVEGNSLNPTKQKMTFEAGPYPAILGGD